MTEPTHIADTDRDTLYEKYRVERTDGKSVGPCFVLELDDPKAWDALLTWADTLDSWGKVTLATQIRKRVLGRMKVHQRLDQLFGDTELIDGQVDG